MFSKQILANIIAKYAVYRKNIIFNNFFSVTRLDSLWLLLHVGSLDVDMFIIEHTNGLNSSIEYSITCIEFKEKDKIRSVEARLT